MAVNSVMANFRGHGFKPQGKPDAFRAHHQHRPKNEEQTSKVKEPDSIIIEKPEQSKSAQTLAYLAQLSEKFDNVNFIVGNKNDHSAPKNSNGKEYNCYISLDLLKQMARDDKIAEKYEGIIADATKQLGSLKQQVEEKGYQRFITSYNAKVNDDGKVEYSVGLKHSHFTQIPRLKMDNVDELMKKIDAYANGKISAHEFREWGKGFTPQYSHHYNNNRTASFSLPNNIFTNNLFMANQFKAGQTVFFTGSIQINGSFHVSQFQKMQSMSGFSIGSYDINGVKRMDFPFLVSSGGWVGPQTVTNHVGFFGITYNAPPKINPDKMKSFGPINPMPVKMAKHAAHHAHKQRNIQFSKLA